MDKGAVDRARGCLLGQLVGDALGSLVEFQRPEEIWEKHPDGLREMSDGGAWDTIAGQPTDDSEMALLLARKLVEQGSYDPAQALEAYRYWLETQPFDCGATIYAALHGRPVMESQANGAMMRASPLGILGARYDLEKVAVWARQDASLTHPNPICVEANVLYVKALAFAVRSGPSPQALYQAIVSWAEEMGVDLALRKVIDAASTVPPEDYLTHQGWVLIAFQNALWQLLHCSALEEGIVDSVMRGGDTDTNAAICGALLGAVHGFGAIPGEWVKTVLNCRPQVGRPGVKRPRPATLWPRDALDLADDLLKGRAAK